MTRLVIHLHHHHLQFEELNYFAELFDTCWILMSIYSCVPTALSTIWPSLDTLLHPALSLLCSDACINNLMCLSVEYWPICLNCCVPGGGARCGEKLWFHCFNIWRATVRAQRSHSRHQEQLDPGSQDRGQPLQHPRVRLSQDKLEEEGE